MHCPGHKLRAVYQHTVDVLHFEMKTREKVQDFYMADTELAAMKMAYENCGLAWTLDDLRVTMEEVK